MEHISLREQVDSCLNNISSKINKGNVQIILPLLYWIITKIDLIISAELKKQINKECKNKGVKAPSVLKCSRGEIWEAYLGQNIGSEQNGVNSRFTRPVLIIQNNDNNRKSPNTIIIPLSKVDNRIANHEFTETELLEIKSDLRPTEVLIRKTYVKDGEENLLNHSIALCQNIRELSKERLDFKITSIKDEYWVELNNAIKYSLGIE